MDPVEPEEESRRGFISAPSVADLKPTPEELWRFRQLVRWQEESAKSPIILGVPLKDQPWPY